MFAIFKLPMHQSVPFMNERWLVLHNSAVFIYFETCQLHGNRLTLLSPYFLSYW